MEQYTVSCCLRSPDLLVRGSTRPSAMSAPERAVWRLDASGGPLERPIPLDFCLFLPSFSSRARYGIAIQAPVFCPGST